MNDLHADIGAVTLSPTPVIETGSLILRAPQASDWDAWMAFNLSERSRFVRAPETDEGTAWRAFGHFIGHWVLRGWGNFVITDRQTGAVLGACGPWFPATWPEPELGWTIWVPEAEGRGIAHEAVAAARRFAFDTLGWNTAVSYIDPANDRSRALALRLGCTLDTDAPRLPVDPSVEVWRHPNGGAA